VHLLTAKAVTRCGHGGSVEQRPTQALVYVDGIQLLIDDDPEGREIQHCNNTNVFAGNRPCKHTLKVRTGYSTFVFIAGRRVVLSSLDGLTDGTPPGIVHYTMRRPGQEWIESGS
jgi:hypothetical protein